MSEPIRYSEVSNDWNGEAAGLAPSADGELVKYEDYARLHSLFANSEQENARLKADVERLTFDPLTYLDDQGEWMPRHIHLAAVARLKAEVERLTKAGDDLEFLACFNYSGDINEDEHSIKILDAWHAAKVGKPSV